MSIDQLARAVDLPYWDPWAIAAGVVVGFIAGALTIGLLALRLWQLQRIPRAGSGHANLTSKSFTLFPKDRSP